MLKLVLFLIFINFIELEAADTRIVNGIDAEEGEFPFAVSLRKNGRHTCGGTILNKNFILTAAHCVHELNIPLDPQLFTIQYGLTRRTLDDTNIIQVENIFCKDYNYPALTFDVAVLKLASSLPMVGKWEPVIISKEFYTKENQNGIIIGWGRLSHGGPLSINLQKLNVTVYDHSSCKFPHDLVHHICIGADNAGACKGDSGSALLINKIQVGIASFITTDCGIADENRPNIYSNVATYYDWIVGIAGHVKTATRGSSSP